MTIHDTETTISRGGSLSVTRHNLRSGTIAVCGRFDVTPSGPLAEYVTKSQDEYGTQYMTGGDRKRMPGHVYYYVTTPGGYVLGFVTVAGHVETAPSTEVTPRRLAAIRAGLEAFAKDAPNLHGIEGDGQHPAGYDDATDSGATFHVYARDTRESVLAEREPILTTTDRNEAHAAMRKATDEGNQGRGRWEGLRVVAWIVRTTPETETQA